MVSGENAFLLLTQIITLGDWEVDAGSLVNGIVVEYGALLNGAIGGLVRRPEAALGQCCCLQL